MSALFQDLKYGLRVLAKRPGFTAVAIITLAVGIGANTAIFSVFNALFLHPAGISNPGSLVTLRVKYKKFGLKSIVVSVPGFAQVRDSKQIFAAAAIENGADFNYNTAGWPQRLQGAEVSWQWFNVFQAKPLLGRTFTSEEDQPGANHEIVLAYRAWRRWFGGDRGIVGRSVMLNQQFYRVVGVMGPGFRWPRDADLWTPLGLSAEAFAPGNLHNESYFAVARLRTGVKFAQAKSFVDLLTAQDVAKDPYAKESGWGMFVVPLVDFVFGNVRTPLFILAVAVGFVLLIACANVAGLVLARATGRSREFAVRAALGASPWRLARQALAENVILAAAGAVCGLGLAAVGIRALLRLAPVAESSFPMDGHVLLFTLAVSVIAVIIFGVAPAWETTRLDPNSALKEGGWSATASPVRQRFRSGLVVAELALVLVLLAGTGLLLRSFLRLGQVNPGFSPQGVMTAALALPKVTYNTPSKQIAFFRTVIERLSSAPGVTSAAAGFPLPFSGGGLSASFEIEGRPVAPGGPGPWGEVRYVTPGWFRTFGIPLLRGRVFTNDDGQGTERVAVIDQALARRYWPNESPIGRKIRRRGGAWSTIVGVVGNIRFSQLAGEEMSSEGVQSGGKGTYYFSMYQTQAPYGFLIARTQGNPLALTGIIRGTVRDVDRNQPVWDLKSMEARIEASLGPRRFATTLLSIFAGIAILLAAVGLYGLISYAVTRRTHEIGIRIAMGAQRKDILWMVLKQSLVLAGIGIAVGLLLTLAMGRLIASQLYGLRPSDPATLGLAALVLVAVAMLATYIPARRASRVDPVVALRCE